MNKYEFAQLLDPLLTAFEKTMAEKLMNLWFEECKDFQGCEIKSAVRHFLDSPSQKSFPRVGEFKAFLGSSGRSSEAAPSGKLHSCSRCSHGFCSVTRWVGQSPVPVRYTFRCSCPSGSHFPGLPPVSPFEQTEKEARASGRENWEKREKLIS